MTAIANSFFCIIIGGKQKSQIQYLDFVIFSKDYFNDLKCCTYRITYKSHAIVAFCIG